jgi:hypothetical protein
MNLTISPTGAAGGDSRDQSTTQKHPLGTLGVGPDGSKHRYAKCGTPVLVAGNCLQSPAAIGTTHLAMTPSAAAIGATQVTFTLGATLASANQYAEGWLQLDTTPGQGRRYRIASHPAAASGAVLTVTLFPDDPISEIAISTATRVGLVHNPYNGVIQMPQTTATGTLVGVANCALAAGSFGWIQTQGMAAPLIAGTPALGAIVMTPGAVAGAAEIIVAAGTLIVAQVVGKMMQVGVAGKNNSTWLMIE